MRIPGWLFGLLVVACFGLGVLLFRDLGVWRGRERAPPPREVETPPAFGPAPGGTPM